MAITQLVLTWILLGVLLIWMVTFAILAIRPHSSKKVALENFPTPSHPIPLVSAPTVLRVIASQPSQSHVGAMSSEPPNDLGATPVA